MTAFQLFLVQKCEICVFFWSQHLRRLSPYFIPKILINMASGHVSMRYGFQVNFLITIWHSYVYCQMNVNRNSYASNLGSKPCCCDSLCDRCSLYWWCYTDDSIWRCRCVMADGGTESSIDAFSIVGFSRQLCSWCFVLFVFENSSLYTLVTGKWLECFSNVTRSTC